MKITDIKKIKKEAELSEDRFYRQVENIFGKYRDNISVYQMGCDETYLEVNYYGDDFPPFKEIVIENFQKLKDMEIGVMAIKPSKHRPFLCGINKVIPDHEIRSWLSASVYSLDECMTRVLVNGKI